MNRKAGATRWELYTTLPPIYRSSIPETDEGKYLGVKFGRGNNLFKNHAETLVNKAKFNKWRLSGLTKEFEAKSWYGTIIWGVYGIPNILYGSETIPVTKTCLYKLDTVHHTHLRSLFGWNNSVAKAAVWGETGILPPSWQIAQRKINYFQYLHNIPNERLAKVALGQQKLWEIRNDSNYTNSWLSEVKRYLLKMEIPNEIIAGRDNLKNTIRLAFIREFNFEKNRLTTLRYYDKNKPKPDKALANRKYGKMWLKAKVGGLFLNERNAIKICMLCGAELESVEHFLFQCPILENILPIPNNIMLADNVNKCRYIFSGKRNTVDRDILGAVINTRWKAREEFEVTL